jgi:thymidine kinase
MQSHSHSNSCFCPTFNTRSDTSLLASLQLYFRHGAVSSAKTLDLLAVAHSYKAQGKGVVLMKPSIDVRFGEDIIQSRAGLSSAADILISPTTRLLDIPVPANIHCVLVDEAQFLSPEHINELRQLTVSWKVPVIAYGLRTDFKTTLFPGSKRLLELADSIEEVKTTCYFCNSKAVFNLKHVDGRAVVEGESVEMGAEERYLPGCYGCYEKELMKGGKTFPRGEVLVKDVVVKEREEIAVGEEAAEISF